jgi:hypothetical protein
MSKVKDFKAFMKAKVNESEDLEGMEAGMNYGANPEDEEDAMDLEGMEEEEGLEGEEEEEVTIEDLKAIVDDLEERISALEGGDEEGEEDEDAEGEEEESEEEEEEV